MSLNERADSGDVAAQIELARMFQTGRGMYRNPRQAARYFQMAADQGNAEAAFEYGQILERGTGVGRNSKGAMRYFTVAAEAGHVRAACELGKLFLQGRDMRNATRFLRMAADKGNSEAQSRLAALIEKNPHRGDEKFEEAAKYYKMSADNGNPFGQVGYGVMLEEGRGVAKNVKEAVRYYQLAARRGNVQAEFQLGRIYESGSEVEKDVGQAIHYYRASADKGNMQALINMCRLLNEQGDEQKQEARALMKRAADNNSTQAMVEYSKMMEIDDPEQSMAYCKRAVDRRDVDGIVRYGLMVCAGIGCQRNDTQGLKILREAEQMGSAEAQYRVACLMKAGRGCPKDEKEAFRLLREAAAKGHPKAKEIVANVDKKERETRESAALAAAEEERLQKLHAELSRPRDQEENEKKKGGRHWERSIPAQGLPKDDRRKEIERLEKQRQEQHRQEQARQQKLQEQQALKAVAVDDDRDGGAFVESKEEQKKHGGPKAQYKLAKRFLSQDNRDLTLAYHFLKLAAERIPEAMMELSELLERGEIGPELGKPQFAASRHYLMCGVRVLHIPAMLRLSKIYEEGIGTEPNKTESVKYLKLAADTGDPESQYRISQILISGELGKVNAELANSYLEKAAKGKWLKAQLEMAAKLEGTPEAIPYLEGAAENGDLESMRKLGRLFASSHREKAKRFLRMAAEKGTEEDKKACEELQ